MTKKEKLIAARNRIRSSFKAPPSAPLWDKPEWAVKAEWEVFLLKKHEGKMPVLEGQKGCVSEKIITAQAEQNNELTGLSVPLVSEKDLEAMSKRSEERDEMRRMRG